MIPILGLPRGGGGESLFSGLPPSLFILASSPTRMPTCRLMFRVDTCPISPYLKWLGVVVKDEKHGFVRCRVLNCSNGSLSFVLCHFSAFPFQLNDLGCHHQD